MKIKCSHSEVVDVDTLVGHPRNPNKHSEKQIKLLAKILKHQGWRHPITISNRSGFVVSGHGRLEAARSLGWTEVPIDRQDFETEADEYAHLIADNKIAELADLNLRMVNEDAIKLGEGFDFDLLGIPDFEPVLVEHLDPQCDEDDSPSVKQETISKPGDVWILGRHRLVCGDATVLETYNKLMDGKKADMVFTDPPYNVAYEGKTKEGLTIQNDDMDDDQFYKFLYDFYSNVLMNMEPGAAIYVAHDDAEGGNFRKALKDSGLLLKQCIIWLKNTIVMGRQDYHWKHEPILYGWAPGGSHKWYSDRKQSTVFECKKPARNGEHPTMKPVELVEYFIGNSSKEGDRILDPFGGSGTTLIAAEKTGRIAYLCELDPKYCDVIVSRWEKYTGKSATRHGEA